MDKLSGKECVPCKGGIPPLKGEELRKLNKQLENWKIVKEHHLEKEYKLKDFKEALDFTNKVGRLAEEQNHHPDIYLSYGKVKIILWTHKIDGLKESDFIFAKKVDEVE